MHTPFSCHRTLYSSDTKQEDRSPDKAHRDVFPRNFLNWSSCPTPRGCKIQQKKRGRKRKGQGASVRERLYRRTTPLWRKRAMEPRPIIPVVDAESYMPCIRDTGWIERNQRRELRSSNNSEIKTELKSVSWLDGVSVSSGRRAGRERAIRCRGIEVTRATDAREKKGG